MRAVVKSWSQKPGKLTMRLSCFYHLLDWRLLVIYQIPDFVRRSMAITMTTSLKIVGIKYVASTYLCSINTFIVIFWAEVSLNLVSLSAERKKATENNDAPSLPISTLAKAYCLILDVESGQWSGQMGTHMENWWPTCGCGAAPGDRICDVTQFPQPSSENMHGKFLEPSLTVQMLVYFSRSVNSQMGYHLCTSKHRIRTLVSVLQIRNLSLSQVTKFA